mgnify:CR=1 FL=1
MAINIKTTPFLFSIGTEFSYLIDKRYYDNIHYVWCTTRFHDKSQPVTSNPQSICKRYLEQLLSGDRHTKEINDNKAGVLRGAQAKLDAGIIDKEQYEEICQLVNLAMYDAFFPVLYIIDVKKVGSKRCIEVETSYKASDASVEYKIVDLHDGEYEIINFKQLLSDFVSAVDKKAGK